MLLFFNIHLFLMYLWLQSTIAIRSGADNIVYNMVNMRTVNNNNKIC